MIAEERPFRAGKQAVARPKQAVSSAGRAASSEVLRDALLPQTPAGVFDRAFDLYKQHFIHLTLLVALVYLPTQILLHALMDTWLRPLIVHLDGSVRSPDIVGLFTAVVGGILVGVPQVGVPGLLSFLILILVSGPVTLAVSDTYLGQATTTRDSFRRARSHAFRLVGGWFLAALAFLGASMVVFFVMVIVLSLLASLLPTPLPDEFGFLFGLLILLTPYIVGCAVIAKWFCFTTPLLVLERQPFFSLTARNSQLVSKNSFRRAWAAMIFLPLVTYGLQFLILASTQSAISALKPAPLLEFLAGVGAAAAITLLFQPYAMIFLTLLYYDYRIRREGLDLSLLIAQLPAPAVTAVPPTVPPLPARPAPTPPPIVPALPPIANRGTE